MTSRLKKLAIVSLGCIAALAVICLGYIRSHPLVFNESFWGHAHCIKGGGLDLVTYALDHDGRFPFHTNGYGDALVLVNNGWDAALTGPGYDARVFDRVRRTGENAPESEFGRVYVQGLSDTDAAEIAILFDKLPTPGGDHCHFLRRMTAPLGREVWTIGAGMTFIPESKWSLYAKRQVELLMAAGMPRQAAERYYFEEGKR